MRGGNDRHLSLGQQVLGLEPCEIVDRAVHQRHVGRAGAQQAGLLAHLAQHHLDRYGIRYAGMRIEQEAQQLVRGPGLGREREHLRGVRGPPRALRGSLDGGECQGGLPVQHPPGVRELDTPAIPVEEPGPEPPLQLLDRARQRRLGDAQPLGGPPEMQLLGHRQEISQLARLENVHGATLRP